MKKEELDRWLTEKCKIPTEEEMERFKQDTLRQAQRKQLSKMLELYRSPDKTPPKLKSNLDEVFGQYMRTLEEAQARLKAEQEQLEANRRRAQRDLENAERERRRRQNTPKPKVAAQTGRRKIILED